MNYSLVPKKPQKPAGRREEEVERVHHLVQPQVVRTLDVLVSLWIFALSLPEGCVQMKAQNILSFNHLQQWHIHKMYWAQTVFISITSAHEVWNTTQQVVYKHWLSPCTNHGYEPLDAMVARNVSPSTLNVKCLEQWPDEEAWLDLFWAGITSVVLAGSVRANWLKGISGSHDERPGERPVWRDSAVEFLCLSAGDGLWCSENQHINHALVCLLL